MRSVETDNLARELSVLGKKATLSLSARQRVRDQLFKKIGQLDLIDAVQTKTDVDGLVMPLQKLLSIFKPTQVSFGVPATAGLVVSALILSVTTGALAQNAGPDSPLLYTVRTAMEDLQVTLQPNPTKKAELKLEIASDRLALLSTANSKNIQVALTESKKALADAQAAVSSLERTEDGEALTAKLATIIGSQKDILTTIVKGNIGDETVQQGIAQLRAELDALLEPTATKPVATVTEPKPATTTTPVPAETNPTYFRGSFVTAFGAPALNVGSGVVYPLVNVPTDFLQYVGTSKVEVAGSLTNNQLTVGKLYINSKLVWEAPAKIENNLPRVEGDQNQLPG